MNREQLLAVLKQEEVFKSKAEAERFLAKLDEALEVIAEDLKDGEKVRFGSMISIEKKFVAGKEGVLAGKPFTTQDHSVIKVKASSLLK